MPDIYDAFQRLGCRSWNDAAKWLGAPSPKGIIVSGAIVKDWCENDRTPPVVRRMLRLTMGLLDAGLEQSDIERRMRVVSSSVRRKQQVHRPSYWRRSVGAEGIERPIERDPPPPPPASGDGTQMEPPSPPLTGKEFQRMMGLLGLPHKNSTQKFYGVSNETVQVWCRRGPSPVADRIGRLMLGLLEEGMPRDVLFAMLDEGAGGWVI